MNRVWGYEAALDTGTVTVHVRRLREKIEDDPVPSAPPADGLGRRLPLLVAVTDDGEPPRRLDRVTLGVGLDRSRFALRLALHASASSSSRSRSLAVCLPLAAVLALRLSSCSAPATT